QRSAMQIGIPAFVFLDDHVLAFPSCYYPDHRRFYEDHSYLIRQILRVCDGLITSTPAMACTYGKHCKNVYMIPATVSEPPQRNVRCPDGRFVVGYAGSPGHTHDLGIIIAALLAFYHRHPGEVALQFYGCLPQELVSLQKSGNIVLRPWNQN